MIKRPMKKHVLCAALSIAAIIVVSCSRDRGAVVAEVNGRVIHAADVAYAMQSNSSKYDSTVAHMPQASSLLAKNALDMLIQEAILLGEAEHLKIAASDDEIRGNLTSYFGTANTSDIAARLKQRGIDPDAWLDAQQRKLIIGKLIDREVVEKIPVTDEEIRAYYVGHQKEFSLPLQYHARQILVDTRAKADEVMRRIRKGEDFTMLAHKYSVSPDAERGGDLGFFGTKDVPRIFSEICAGLRPGQTSSVKETDYGYQIFQLLEIRRPRVRTIDEARDEIVLHIRNERSPDAFVEWFDNLRRASTVVIHDDALREVDNHARFDNNR